MYSFAESLSLQGRCMKRRIALLRKIYLDVYTVLLDTNVLMLTDRLHHLRSVRLYKNKLCSEVCHLCSRLSLSLSLQIHTSRDGKKTPGL
jgi:hypothetical protein